MCVGLPGRRSIGPGLIFLLLFVSRQKVKSIEGFPIKPSPDSSGGKSKETCINRRSLLALTSAL